MFGLLRSAETRAGSLSVSSKVTSGGKKYVLDTCLWGCLPWQTRGNSTDGERGYRKAASTQNSRGQAILQSCNLLGTRTVHRQVWRQGCLSCFSFSAATKRQGTSTVHLSSPHSPYLQHGAVAVSPCLPDSAMLGGGGVAKKQHMRKHPENRRSKPTNSPTAEQAGREGMTEHRPLHPLQDPQ